MKLRSWCTEPLENHVLNVVTLALGEKPVTHPVFETISLRLGLPKPSSDPKVDNASKFITKRFEASCKRLASLARIELKLARDLTLVTFALHDVGKCCSALSSVFAKVDSMQRRCIVSTTRIYELLDRVLDRVKQRRFINIDKQSAEKYLASIVKTLRDAIGRFKDFGCPLDGGVCPRLLIFEIERNLDKVIPNLDSEGFTIAKTFLRLLHRESSSLCRCYARPSLVGHEIPSAYAFYVLTNEALRKLGIDAESRRKLASLLAISILLHHYASRNLDTAMDRLSGKYLPMISLDSGVIESIEKSLQIVEKYLESKELIDELNTVLERTMHSPIERSIYVPTLIESLQNEVRELAKLYVVPLEPLCLADSLASYLGRGVGSPPSIARALLHPER